MKHKIVRADGTTILQPIKSFHYTAQCNFGEDLRYGTVIPSSIEVEVFYNGSNMVSVGEELTYYQVFDVDSAFNPSTETTDKIGLFTVYECNKIGKDIYRFVAYDNLRKLDADFSERLRELNESNSFPMSAGVLLSEAASVAGVTYNFPPITMNWQLITLNSFYSDSITCKDIFSAAAELQATYWFCNSEGVLYIDDYATKQKPPFWSDERYIICPTDQQQYYNENEMELVPVFYKQDGLTQSDYYIHQVDSVKIIRSDGVMLGAAAQFTQDNTYYISGNVFADMAEISDWASYGSQKMSQRFVNIARFVYNQIQTDTSYSYRKTDVRLFPFRFPFSIGSMVWIENTDGLRYRMPVMHIDITDSAVILNAFGNEYYTDITGAYNTADQKATSLDIRLNKLSESNDNKVSKSGDTMTGNLTIEEASNGQAIIKADDITRGTTPPDGNTYLGQFRIVDGNDAIFGWLSNMYTGGRQVQTRLGARNINESTSEFVDNQLILAVRNNGERLVTVTDSAPWRTALGAVNIAGDTMTGNLFLKDDRVDLDVIPSSAVNGRYLGYHDAQDRNYFYHQVSQTTNGQISSAFNVSNKTTGGTTVNHRITMRINKDGTREVAFTEVDPWLTALGLDLQTTNTISDIATNGSGCTITAANYRQFGKVAQIAITATKTSAATSVTSVTLGTLVSGKRPSINSAATSNNANAVYSYINTSGACVVRGTFTANQSVTIFATFLLA